MYNKNLWDGNAERNVDYIKYSASYWKQANKTIRQTPCLKGNYSEGDMM